ncbi:MAG: VCBS repeat-containing protein [Bacteroidetes bacterium]|nr:MAG: VCBS repeat-containing protein [Bacteroidota bacterium]
MRHFVVIGLIAGIAGCWIACQPVSDEARGAQLAQTYCSSCHLFPAPHLLPAHLWEENVLPVMGAYLGYPTSLLPPLSELSMEEQYNIERAGVFPATPQLSQRDWKLIQQYIINQAPAQAEAPAHPLKLQKGLPHFREKIIRFPLQGEAMTTYLGFDTLSGNILAADARSYVFELDSSGQIRNSQRTPSPLVDVLMHPNGNSDWLTIGNIFPNDRKEGIFWQSVQGYGFQARIENLGRPVDFNHADLNQDGLQDVVICSFGHHTGQLAWYEQLPDGRYATHVLSHKPGAVKTEIADLNGDGLPDILALMGQGDEGVFAYLSQGEGQFEQRALLRFPPVYGSSDMKLTDFDQDGDLDLLYVNGDNADYSYSKKAYHGLRIFTNEGQLRFSEAFFAPVFGATRLETADFDLDGDTDIALVAFFPDFEQEPLASFVYFQNISTPSSPWQFEHFGLHQARAGRWLVLNAHDYDRDGDTDLLLGSFTLARVPVPESLRKNWQQQPANLLLLENELNP